MEFRLEDHTFVGGGTEKRAVLVLDTYYIANLLALHEVTQLIGDTLVSFDTGDWYQEFYHALKSMRDALNTHYHPEYVGPPNVAVEEQMGALNKAMTDRFDEKLRELLTAAQALMGTKDGA